MSTSEKPQPTTADKLRIIQQMRTILSAPPSDTLKAVIKAAHDKTEDPTFKAFLNLLASENQRNRDIAATIYRDMEAQITKAAAGEAAPAPVAEAPKLAHDGLPMVDLDKPTATTDTKVFPTVDADAAQDQVQQLLDRARNGEDATLTVRDPAAALELAQSLGLDTTGLAAAFGLAELSAATPAAEQTPVVRTNPPTAEGFVPFLVESTDVEHYEIGIVNDAGQQTEKRIYSIITTNTPEELLTGKKIRKIAGLVVGMRNQLSLIHGFGWVLPLVAQNDVPADRDDWRHTLRVSLSYPNALAVYDDHSAPQLPLVSQFFAAHQCLRGNYRFLIEAEIVKIGHRYVMGNNPNLMVQHVDKDGATIPAMAADLATLDYASKHLAVIGFLAEVEQ